MLPNIRDQKASGAAARLFASPLGPLRLKASPLGITDLAFSGDSASKEGSREANGHLDQLCHELSEYFAGRLMSFIVSLDLSGTDFHRLVWQRLASVPFGRTCSYLDLARAIGNPGAVRAVGLANGCNPVAIVIPCHRVIGADGKLVGYGGDLWRKEWLLTHERMNMPMQGLFAADGPTVQVRSTSSPSPRPY